MRVYKIVGDCPEIDQIIGGETKYVDVEENGEFFRVLFQITDEPDWCYGGATFLTRTKKSISDPGAPPLFETQATLDQLLTGNLDNDWVYIYEEDGYYPWASVKFKHDS